MMNEDYKFSGDFYWAELPDPNPHLLTAGSPLKKLLVSSPVISKGMGLCVYPLFEEVGITRVLDVFRGPCPRLKTLLYSPLAVDLLRKTLKFYGFVSQPVLSLGLEPRHDLSKKEAELFALWNGQAKDKDFFLQAASKADKTITHALSLSSGNNLFNQDTDSPTWNPVSLLPDLLLEHRQLSAMALGAGPGSVLIVSAPGFKEKMTVVVDSVYVIGSTIHIVSLTQETDGLAIAVIELTHEEATIAVLSTQKFIKEKKEGRARPSHLRIVK